MIAMSESALKKKTLLYLKKRFPDAFVWKIADRWRAGVPDLLIIRKGVHVFIELKRETGRLSKIQEYTIAELKKAGSNVFVCNSMDEIKRTFDLLDWPDITQPQGIWG